MNGLGQRAFGDRFNLALQFSTMSLKLSIRGVETRGTGGGGDRLPCFDRTINSNSTNWADYAHHIITHPFGFSDLPTGL